MTDAAIDGTAGAQAMVRVGRAAGDTGDTGKTSDAQRADFVAEESEILTVDALAVESTLAGLTELATTPLRVVGVDAAAVIAGQTLAISAGARMLVTDDVQSTRRIAVMMSQVIGAAEGPA